MKRKNDSIAQTSVRGAIHSLFQFSTLVHIDYAISLSTAEVQKYICFKQMKKVLVKLDDLAAYSNREQY